MDTFLEETADVIDWTVNMIIDYQDTLTEREWSNFNDHFANVVRTLRRRSLKINEFVRYGNELS